MRPFTIITVPLSCALSLAVSHSSGQVVIPAQPIVVTGQPAPGLDEGVYFQALGAGVINNQGQVLFSAILNGPLVGSENNDSLWIWEDGQLHLVLQEGSPAPGTPGGVVFGGISSHAFDDIVFNDQGEFGFKTKVDGPGITSDNDFGIWATNAGQLTLVAREGDRAPGTPDGVVFSNVAQIDVLGATGMVNVLGHLTGPGVDPSNSYGMWVGSPGSLELLFRAGSPLPGVDGTMKVVGVPSANSSGSIAIGVLALVGAENIGGIWAGPPANTLPVVFGGDPAPPAGQDVFFRSPGWDLGFNSNGDIAFSAFLSGDSINNLNDNSLWLASGGNLSLIVQELDLLPEFEEAVRFGPAVYTPVLNDQGMIVFRGHIRPDDGGSNSSCVWLAMDGARSVIAREGDFPPDRQDRGVLGNLASNESRPVLNDVGTTVFLGTLVNSGTSLTAMFTFTENSGLRTLGVLGDVLEFAPGDFRETGGMGFIVPIHGTGGADGYISPLNNQNDLVIVASFPGGDRGLFLMNAGAPCYADFNGDGAVDTLDFLAFLNAFQSSSPEADCDASGAIDTLDFLCFLNAFAAGCP